jgi:putative ABC transport system permease protein
MQNKDTLKNAIALAWDSILAHKLRSFLTLLGVIIGVASVILVGAAIDGLGVYAEQSVAKAFGSESYLIAQIAAAGNMSRREYFERLKTNKPINLPEVNYLRTMNGDRTLYSPDQNKNGVDIKHDNYTADTSTVVRRRWRISRISILWTGGSLRNRKSARKRRWRCWEMRRDRSCSPTIVRL